MPNDKFDRGFKAWCEKIALEYRTQLGLNHFSPLLPDSLAAQLNVRLVSLDVLPLADISRSYLRNDGSNEWSAVTLNHNGITAIVLNDSHPFGRKNNSLMHELSHLILKHNPSSVKILGEAGIALRSYDEKAEIEADWLAGTMLLPKTALMYIKRHYNDEEEIIREYGVSRQLYTFRTNVTGLSRFQKLRGPFKRKSVATS